MLFMCEEVKIVDSTYITEISFCWFSSQYKNIIEHSPGIISWRTDVHGMVMPREFSCMSERRPAIDRSAAAQ